MVFSSLEFLTVFLPIVLFLHTVAPVPWRNPILLFFSLFFYAWGEPVYVLIMIFSIVMNFLFGRWIDRQPQPKKKRSILAIDVVCNLLLLGVFKYTNFFIDNLNLLLPVDIPAVHIVLPIGISFFTFQAMSYVIDVYRKDAPVQNNVLNFGLYISLFPQLIAGPIVRYTTVAQEINHRTLSFDEAYRGVKRFIIGLAKKVLLANNIGYVWSQISETQSTDLTAAAAWLGAVAFAFQIYFDFSGYSDMALGLGHILGFHFLENFDYPYISKSITEFWRRWHISLSTWFKEYVYIPLGGNRHGKAKQIRNILIVWLLTGLWHGASWNFIFWGLYYGVCLLLEKFVFSRFSDKIPAFFRHVGTLLLVLFGWVLFAFEQTGDLFAYLGSMFGQNGWLGDTALYEWTSNGLMLLILALASTPLPAKIGNKLSAKLSGHPAVLVGVEILWFFGLFLLCIAYLVDSTYNPFIYFRF